MHNFSIKHWHVLRRNGCQVATAGGFCRNLVSRYDTFFAKRCWIAANLLQLSFRDSNSWFPHTCTCLRKHIGPVGWMRSMPSDGSASAVAEWPMGISVPFSSTIETIFPGLVHRYFESTASPKHGQMPALFCFRRSPSHFKHFQLRLAQVKSCLSWG